jgi:hypothetical protein
VPDSAATIQPLVQQQAVADVPLPTMGETSDPILFLQNTYCCVQESLLIGMAARIPYWVLLPLLVLLELFLMNPHTYEAAMMSTNQIQLDGGHAR